MSGTEVFLTILGGVALLLWGARMIRTGMTRAFGSQLRGVVASRFGSIGTFLALWLYVIPAAADGPHLHEIYDLKIVVETDQVEADGPFPANRLTIKVHLADGRRIIGREQVIDGTMSQSWARDLDDDGNPEIIVAVTGFGSGSYGELIVFEYEDGVFANRMLPLLPDFLTTGYMGHDTYSVDDVVIRHRYPVYAETDANCCPTGGTLEIEYTYSADRFYVTGVDRDR